MTGITPANGVRAQIWREDTYAVLEVDAGIYPVPAALAAGYKYTDRAYVWLQSAARADHYCVFLKPKDPSDDHPSLASAFANEMLDQALRCRLEQAFSPLRAIITAQAFAEGNLLEVVADAQNGRDSGD
jgi:His-Xaa-Ser system protein HxsD